MASEHLQRSMESIVTSAVCLGWGSAMEPSNSLACLLHTDSIFAVIAEETGLIGSAFTVILYLLLLWRGWSFHKTQPTWRENFWQVVFQYGSLWKPS